jgi:tetratricopeptide (TPR) repeat protein
MEWMLYWLAYGVIWRLVYDYPLVVAAGVALFLLRDRLPNPMRVLRRRQRIATLEAAIGLNPENAEDRSELGELLVESGRAREAVAHLEAAVRKAPDSAGIQFLLGLARLRAGKPADAVPPLEAAVRLDHGLRYGDALLRLGEALAAAGRPREAADTLQAHLKVNASSAEGLYRLAAVRLALGDTAAARDAVRELDATLRISPRFRRRLDRPWLRRARRLSFPAGAAA